MSTPVTKTKSKVEEKPKMTDAEKAAKVANKAARFKAIASKRVSRAINAMQLIGNLAGPNYIYTEEQGAKIVDALQREVDALFDAFKNKVGKEKVAFTL